MCNNMDYKDILSKSTEVINGLPGQALDILEIKQPGTLEEAKHLTKTISKLSPILGNMIEYYIVEKLNTHDWEDLGTWIQQDPEFPDALFLGDITPAPGVEIKTWFPLATEITARFKDSVTHFGEDQTNVALVAWLPENIIYGKPKIIDVWVGSAKSVAESRDLHYHKPPAYLIFEPEDTSTRTKNLQQSNTNGYIFQGTAEHLTKAEKFIEAWGLDGKAYQTTPDYQRRLRTLYTEPDFVYRLDTNYAKMDRIQHEGIEEFKARVLNTKVKGHTIFEWSKLLQFKKDLDKVQHLIRDLM